MTQYESEITEFRHALERDLTASPRNWLSLAGLFWFKHGLNTFGSAAENDFVLPGGPAHGGTFSFDGTSVSIHPAAGLQIASNGGPLEDRPLRSDRDRNPDFLEFDRVIMTVIQRGKETLLRVWDKQSPQYLGFSGLKFFPIDAEYRVDAEWTPYDPPRPIQTMDAIGTPGEGKLLGRARFILGGVECALEAQPSGDELLFNFHDLSNGKTTYGGGRQLTVPTPQNGRVTLDFNRTRNWPCAYSGYATCPLPPAQNNLAVQVAAGEMTYNEHHS